MGSIALRAATERLEDNVTVESTVAHYPNF
jgi:hypothetical protein